MNGKRALNKSSLLSRQKLERDSPILAARNESDSEIGHLKSLCPKEIRSENQIPEFACFTSSLNSPGLSVIDNKTLPTPDRAGRIKFVLALD